MEPKISNPNRKSDSNKDLFLAKFNHLFLSLPNPNDIWIAQLNDILFKYIWSNKPDKIKWRTLMKKIAWGNKNDKC